jgi:ABC-type Fe3+-citrate transport system substrate-binding protein
LALLHRSVIDGHTTVSDAQGPNTTLVEELTGSYKQNHAMLKELFDANQKTEEAEQKIAQQTEVYAQPNQPTNQSVGEVVVGLTRRSIAYAVSSR